jgi:MFS family permease
VLTNRHPHADPDDGAVDAPSAEGRGVDVRSLTSALAGTFALRCASQGAGFLIPILLGIQSRTDADVTSGVASLVFVCFFTAELFSAPVFGALSDRFGRKPIMLLGTIFGAVAAQLLGFTALVPVLVLIRILQGLSTGATAPATLGFLSAETARSPELRGRVMGFYEAATVVGLASGAALAGRAHEHFGDIAFTILACTYLVAVGLFALIRDMPTEPLARVAHGSFVRRLLNGRIMRFAPAWLAANAVLGAWFAQGPFLASRARDPSQFLMGGFGAGQIGMAFLAFGVLFTAGAIVWGFVMPRIGRQATLLAGVGGLAFATVMFWFLNNAESEEERLIVPLLVALVMVGVFVESGFTPAALAYLAEIAEERPEDRGSVMGLYSVLLSVGQVVGGVLAAPFAEQLGFNGLIILTGLLCLVAGATVLALGATERRLIRLPADPAEVA